MEVPRLIDLVLTDRDYTDDEQREISGFVDYVQARDEAVREYVRQNPVPHRLVKSQDRQFRSGFSPAPKVTVFYVVPDPGPSRVGQVQQDDDGKWVGYYVNDAPTATSFGKAGSARRIRDTQEEAVVDVIAQHLLYSGAVRFVAADDESEA